MIRLDLIEGWSGGFEDQDIYIVIALQYYYENLLELLVVDPTRNDR